MMFASLTNSNQPTKHLLLHITYIKTRLLPKVVEFFYLNIPTSISNIAVFLYILLILFGYVQKIAVPLHRFWTKHRKLWKRFLWLLLVQWWLFVPLSHKVLTTTQTTFRFANIARGKENKSWCQQVYKSRNKKSPCAGLFLLDISGWLNDREGDVHHVGEGVLTLFGSSSFAG